MKLFSIVLSTFVFSSAFAQVQPTRYEVVEELVTSLAEVYEDVEEIALPVEGSKDLVGLKIGDGPVSHLVVSTHHGNEYGSTEVAKALMRNLAALPLEDLTVYVIPVVNITGYNANRRWEFNYDPNRDYPGPCGSRNGSFNLKSTKAVADFLDRANIVTAITLHTYSSIITYPWNYARKMPTQNDQVMQSLAAVGAEFNGYRYGRTPDLLYATRGDFQDYAYWEYGIWPFLFELGHTHNPSDQEIQKMIKANVPAIRAMLEKAPLQRAEYHSNNGTCPSEPLAMDLFDPHDE